MRALSSPFAKFGDFVDLIIGKYRIKQGEAKTQGGHRVSYLLFFNDNFDLNLKNKGYCPGTV